MNFIFLKTYFVINFSKIIINIFKKSIESLTTTQTIVITLNPLIHDNSWFALVDINFPKFSLIEKAFKICSIIGIPIKKKKKKKKKLFNKSYNIFDDNNYEKLEELETWKKIEFMKIDNTFRKSCF